MTFIGPVFGDEKKKLLADSDLFVLSSRDEGFPVSVLEAMAFGLPVVVTKECSFPEIETAEAGLVVPFDAVELYRAMERIAADEWAAKRMGINGRNLVLSRYDWGIIAARVFKLYENILARRI